MTFGDLHDHYVDNEELYELYDKKDTLIYKEIVLFMDAFKPDWRKKKELGRRAVDFILDIISEHGDEYSEFREIAEDDLIKTQPISRTGSDGFTKTSPTNMRIEK